MDLERHERDRQWVKQICRGDRKAFKAVYCAYYPELCRYARRFVSRPAVVDDLVQDVFLRIWEFHEDWQVRASLRPYLYGAVRNRGLKHVNRRRLHRDYVERESASSAGPAVTPAVSLEVPLRQRELDAALQAYLDALPPRRREIFALSRFYEFTYTEIAETLDISVKTVETQMSRALKHFREHFAPIRAAVA